MPTREQKIEAMKLARKQLVKYRSQPNSGFAEFYLCNILWDVHSDRPDLRRAVKYWDDFIDAIPGMRATLGVWSYNKRYGPAVDKPHPTRDEQYDLRIRWADWLINCLENP